MTLNQKPLHFYSYNCQGWRAESDFVSELLNKCDVCCIQEHWLPLENLGALNISNEFSMFGVSGMDSSELLSGRPYGGCGIFCRKSLASSVTRLKTCSK